MNFVEPIRDPEKVRDIGEYLKDKSQKLFVMYSIGIYSGLRISDILPLKVRDVRNKKEIRVREIKTGKMRSFPINEELKKILDDYTQDMKVWEFLIPSTHRKAAPISRIYAYKMLREAGNAFGVEHIGSHSLRKTFGYHMFKKTNNIALIMRIFNHSDQSITMRYIGIDQDAINQAIMNLRY